MALESLELQTGDDPLACIIVLHGLGADGSDFLPIARELDLSSVGPTRFVFPHAPVRPVTVNGGYPMRAWYDVLGTDLVQREDEAGLRASSVEVQALLDREMGRGIAPARTVLMGFSQGCALTLLTGLRAPQRLAGLVGLSGYLPLAGTTALERNPANGNMSLFLAHGRFDPIVPLARGQASRDALIALGYPVQWHEYPMEHSVCPEEIEDLNGWLVQVLA
jgi:phospholipase/carboxylesterase